MIQDLLREVVVIFWAHVRQMLQSKAHCKGMDPADIVKNWPVLSYCLQNCENLTKPQMYNSFEGLIVTGHSRKGSPVLSKCHYHWCNWEMVVFSLGTNLSPVCFKLHSKVSKFHWKGKVQKEKKVAHLGSKTLLKSCKEFSISCKFSHLMSLLRTRWNSFLWNGSPRSWYDKLTDWKEAKLK